MGGNIKIDVGKMAREGVDWINWLRAWFNKRHF
jgi:hypothetical protein